MVTLFAIDTTTLDAINAVAPTPPGVTDIGGLAYIILNVALGAGIAVSMIGIILSGIKYMSARGDVKAAATAKSALTYSIVGLLLSMGALTITNIIKNLSNAPTPETSDNWMPGSGGVM